MAGNAAFKRAFSKLLEKTKINAETAVRKCALDMGASMVQMSPVDTGRFRGAWVYGNAMVPGDQPNTPTPEASMGRINAGIADWKGGQTIYIVNNLPYARRLEYGWSKQAPSGVVRITVQNYTRYLEKAVKSL